MLHAVSKCSLPLKVAAGLPLAHCTTHEQMGPFSCFGDVLITNLRKRAEADDGGDVRASCRPHALSCRCMSRQGAASQVSLCSPLHGFESAQWLSQGLGTGDMVGLIRDITLTLRCFLPPPLTIPHGCRHWNPPASRNTVIRILILSGSRPRRSLFTRCRPLSISEHLDHRISASGTHCLSPGCSRRLRESIAFSSCISLHLQLSCRGVLLITPFWSSYPGLLPTSWVWSLYSRGVAAIAL